MLAPLARIAIIFGATHDAINHCTNECSDDQDEPIDNRQVDPFDWLGIHHVGGQGSDEHESAVEQNVQREEDYKETILVLPGAQHHIRSHGVAHEIVTQQNEEAVARASVQADGVFRLEGLDEGTYTVLARKVNMTGGFGILISDAKVVEVPASGEVAVELELR